MRKRLISNPRQTDSAVADYWLELTQAALVEVTSEADGYPVEGALLPGQGRGWRAGTAGSQTIRLLFDEPQKLSRIWVVFEETEIQRTQEFVLKWSADHGRSFREIVRQQWNFSPPATVRETEDYTVDLRDVTILELRIVPDQSSGSARASLTSLRLA